METEWRLLHMNGRAVVHIIQELTAVLDTGLYDAISIRDVHDHIKKGDVLTWISDLGGVDTDLSIELRTNTYGDFNAWYIDCMQRQHNAYSGDERRKWGIEKRGLCLLITWTAELLKHEQIEWPRY
jgi:hypothetical protein